MSLPTHPGRVATVQGWPRLTAAYLRTGIDDLKLVNSLSNGKVDLTFGRCVYSLYMQRRLTPARELTTLGVFCSALDIFGGSQVKFDDLVAYNANAVPASA